MISKNSVSKVGLVRNKKQLKKMSDHELISAKKAMQLDQPEYRVKRRVLIVPKCVEIQNVYNVNHGLCHSKTEEMRNSLCNMHCFKNLNKFFNFYNSRWQNCARIDNSIHHNYTAPLKRLTIGIQPFYAVHVDLSGPFPDQNEETVTSTIAVDRLKRQMEIEALPSNDSEFVEWWIFKNVICC